MAIDGNLIANFHVSEVVNQDSLRNAPVYFTLSSHVTNVTHPGFLHQVNILNIAVRQRNSDIFFGIVTINQRVLVLIRQVHHEVVVAFQGLGQILSVDGDGAGVALCTIGLHVDDITPIGMVGTVII